MVERAFLATFFLATFFLATFFLAVFFLAVFFADVFFAGACLLALFVRADPAVVFLASCFRALSLASKRSSTSANSLAFCSVRSFVPALIPFLVPVRSRVDRRWRLCRSRYLSRKVRARFMPA
ncbi:MAG: hypothetical protein EA419_07520 [Wenzhouxiangella sp.]|nr:MAG: hypothetical protein EA419_07520 [Wenzhouxiangella sp.]